VSTVSTRESRRASKGSASNKVETHEPKGFQPPSKLARKKPALIALCIALALVGGLITYFGLTSNGQKPVLVVKTDIQRGAIINAGDLTTINIATDAGNGAVSADKSSTVIGKTATVDLPKGSLVLSNNIGSGLGIKADTSVVGVALSSAQTPARPLQAGDRVRIIRTPTQGATIDEKTVPVPGTVDSTKFDTVKGLTVVDVVVAQNDAANVVAWSAAGNAGLILDPLTGTGK
jgi:hypothetical protein